MVKNLPAMQETWVQSLVWEDPLEKGMAAHWSILAWTKQPGGLQSMGSQRSDVTEWQPHTHNTQIYVIHKAILYYTYSFSIHNIMYEHINITSDINIANYILYYNIQVFNMYNIKQCTRLFFWWFQTVYWWHIQIHICFLPHLLILLPYIQQELQTSLFNSHKTTLTLFSVLLLWSAPCSCQHLPSEPAAGIHTSTFLSSPHYSELLNTSCWTSAVSPRRCPCVPFLQPLPRPTPSSLLSGPLAPLIFTIFSLVSIVQTVTTPKDAYVTSKYVSMV